MRAGTGRVGFLTSQGSGSRWKGLPLLRLKPGSFQNEALVLRYLRALRRDLVRSEVRRVSRRSDRKRGKM